MPPSIFISYSHADSSLVGPVVALLRASEALVFRDADSIRPGKRWREEVDTAISGASFVVVFWCCHAKASEEVGNEITTAIAQQKDILPLLIDETPLPNHLAEFQYIDFRTAFGKGHGLGMDQPRVAEARSNPGKIFWAAVSLIGLVVAALSMTRGLSVGHYERPPDVVGLSPTGLLLLALLVGLALWVLFPLRWARKRRAMEGRIPPEVPLPPQYPRYLHMMLAQTIEEELLRRTGARAPAIS
jgi:TIR domain